MSLFDEVINQPGKSPDTSMLAAGVFPWMEREVDEPSCSSKVDIHKAALSVWRSLKHHQHEGRQLLRRGRGPVVRPREQARGQARAALRITGHFF